VHVVKIRKVGSGNVVSVPSALAESGYSTGQQVTIQKLPNGDLLVRRVVDRSEQLQSTARRLMQKHRKSLEILEAYDKEGVARPRPEPVTV
jgi:antitoxin component of MazEF toxin-antitoxin module